MVEHTGSKDGSDTQTLLYQNHLSPTVAAGACFCLASGSMTLLNKAALSSFPFSAPTTLLFFQCSLCVLLVYAFRYLGTIKTSNMDWNIVKLWYPVNMIFVAMLLTSFWALKELGVATSTILKSTSNIFVIAAEYFLYGRVYNIYIWGTMGLMILSAFCGGLTDLNFSASGYTWQLINGLLTASYTIYLKIVLEKVKGYTRNGEKLDEFTMVFYNNLLSLPVLGILMLWQGELNSLLNQREILHNPYFMAIVILTGLMSFGISFSVLWFLSTTTPTTFALVGALNKVPVSIFGLFAFDSQWSTLNLLSISFGLLSGVIFVIAKQKT